LIYPKPQEPTTRRRSRHLTNHSQRPVNHSTPVTMPNHADEKPGHGSDDKEEITDVRGGVRFRTGIAYDDAYAGTSGGDDDDYVNSLPTVDEERK